MTTLKVKFVSRDRANAKAHRELLQRLKKMTPDQLFKSVVAAGIYTSDGELTARYRTTVRKPMRKAAAKKRA